MMRRAKGDLGSRVGAAAVAVSLAYALTLPFAPPDSRQFSKAFRAAPASLAGIQADHSTLEPICVKQEFVAAAFVPEARVVNGLEDAEMDGEHAEAIAEFETQIPTPSLSLLQEASEGGLERPAAMASIEEFLALDEEAFEMDETTLVIPDLDEDSGSGSSFTCRTHVSRKGETIRQIAAAYRAPIEHLEVINGFKADRELPRGEKILVPVGLGTFHLVGKKENIWTVAKKYNLKPSTVVFFNRAKHDDLTLKAGESLFIPLGAIDSAVSREIASNRGIRNLLENKLSFVWPVNGGRISSRFGWRVHPIYHRGRQHTGIDIALPTGRPIMASERGRVVWADWRGGAGRCVIVEHPNGMYSYYMHCSRILVKRGQHVSRRQVIAKIGSTGLATGPHLHFSLKRDGRMINPMKYLALKLK